MLKAGSGVKHLSLLSEEVGLAIGKMPQTFCNMRYLIVIKQLLKLLITVPASVANDIEEMLVLTMYIIYTYMYMCTHHEEPMCFSVLSSTTLPSSSVLQKMQPTAISLTSTSLW